MTTLLRSSLATAADQDPISPDTMHAFIGATYGGVGNFANTSVRSTTGPDGKPARVVNQHLKAGTFGMPGGSGNGTGIALSGTPLGGVFYEASIEYDLRFVGSGRWPLGGKLPGLGGVLAGHGSPPGGGKPSRYGWSGRPMHRKNRADPTTGLLVGYVYDPLLAPGSVGQDRKTGKVLRWNTWYRLKQTYKMNTILTEGVAGRPDGVHRMWLDGELCFENLAQVYRLYLQAKATHLMWDIFCGGNDALWCPVADFDVQVTNVNIVVP